jgi:aspartyl/asparaginyl beta-hydroxylase (cupin superfamily)
MRRVARQIAKIVFILVPLAYFFPKIVLAYLLCGLYDVSRNDERTLELFERYFLGNGLLVWLLSPINILLDLLSLPYVNKGVYRLADLPEGHQREITSLIESARRQDLVRQLQQAASAEMRSMFFFKWYGTNVEMLARVPEFHEKYKYITTIGVSVFNKRQSTAKHFGPLRATLRVLYNLDEVVDNSAYIVVGKTTQYWRENKLFIFDDTLFHQSFNETDRPRYCLFVDIVRQTTMPVVFKIFVRGIGKLMSQGMNHVFYSHWKVLKGPARS